MSISTYSELQTAVENWLDRSDLTSRIPEFIALCEASYNYGVMAMNKRWAVEPLRIRAMETSGDVTISAQTASIPTGYLAARRFYLNTTDQRQLEYLPPVDFWGRYGSSSSGEPIFYTAEADNFVFMPAPGDSYTGKLLYYKKLDALSDSNTTNWLLTNAPNAYLFGTLYEAYNFAEGGQGEAENYLGRFAGVINALNAADASDRHSGAVLQMRTGVTA